MKFTALQPFVPSGKDFESSKQLFLELGFTISWDAGDYVSFEKDASRFILQKFDNKEFAENFMITIRVDDVNEFYKQLLKNNCLKNLEFRYHRLLKCLMGKNRILLTLPGCAGIL